MSEDPATPPQPPPDAGGVSAWVGELERALQRNVEPLLDRLKQAVWQAALGAIDETVRRYGVGLGDEVRQTLRTAVDEVVRAQVGRLVAELAPSGDTAKRLADGLHQELRDFANTTLRDLFETRLPEYSRWAGRSIIDYALAGLLFAIAAVLLFAGGVLALNAAGVPPYATYLIGGVVALGFGFVLLKAREWRGNAPPMAAGQSGKPPG